MSEHTITPPAPARVWPLLLAQAADGAGAKFHTVALSLYILLTGGLTAMSGFIASGLLGSVAAVATAAVATRRLSGRQLMATAALTLLASRLLAFVLVAVGAPIWAYFVGQFVGSVAGTVLINCSKSQAPPVGRARTLAWMGVANGAGAILGAVAAGALTSGSPRGLLVAFGMVAATVATAPMLALSGRTSTPPLPLAAQWAAVRRVALPVLLGGACFASVGGFTLLANGLVAELYGPNWVGLLTASTVAGSWLAAASIQSVQRAFRRIPTTLSWPAAGLAALGCWSLADRRVLWLLLAAGASGLLLGWVAVSVETRVLDGAGQAAAPALTLSGAGAALLQAGSVRAVPISLADHGYPTTVLWLSLVLVLTVAVLVLARRWVRHRRASPPRPPRDDIGLAA